MRARQFCPRKSIICGLMRRKGYLWGAVCGILAAVSYGMNPLGALPLYHEGVATETVLLYRFGFAIPILALFMCARGVAFALSRRTFLLTASLGLLFAASSLTFYSSFQRMPVGVVCTILFVYPVMTAAIMTAFYGERLTVKTVASIALALGGIAFLSLGGGELRIDLLGVVLVLISALTYAIYIVVVNRARVRMPVSAMTFWVLVFCFCGVLGWSVAAGGSSALHLPGSARQWGFGIFLAVVPTLLSLLFMVVSDKRLGSTPTAILGALEPLTAVCVGIFVFGEQMTLRLGVGMVCVLAAAVTILCHRGRK